MRGRFFVRGRKAHQARDSEAEFVAAFGDEREGFFRREARFLRFFAGVDLHEQFWRAPCPLDFEGEGFGQAFAVKRVDGVEQGYGVAGLVRLQGTDEVELKLRGFGLESREFRGGLLHAVFTEDALACGHGLTDGVYLVGFADGDEGHALRNAGAQAGEVGGDGGGWYGWGHEG